MKISIIIPVYNVKEFRFRRTIESIFKQSYDNFEICISDSSTENNNVEDIVNEFNVNNKIKYIKSTKKLGISDNTNEALKMASGDIIALLDHDDLLHDDALEKVYKSYVDYNCDVTYSDEQIVDDSGKIINKFYKPCFSPDLLYSQNYICHFLTFKYSIFKKVGFFNSKYDGAQDYDYILRLYENTNNIFHIDSILYDWLSTESSTSTNFESKPYAQIAGLNALNDHLKRLFGNTAKAYETDNLFVYETKFNLLKKEKVGIIVPMKNKWKLTDDCIKSIIKNTNYKNYEILILDNNSDEKKSLKWLNKITQLDNRIRVLKADMEFNWSKLQNYGIQNCDADCYIFLNNDTLIINPNWIDVLCSNALREDIGVVGPLLLYDDKTIQHAGVVIGMGGYADHVYKGCKSIHCGINYVSPMVNRNVLAVTGACMAISKKTLNKIGYFDEKFIICGSDVEICVRAYEKGLRNLYTPFVTLMHLESKSRDSFIPEVDFEMSRKCYKYYWDNGDPFYNKNLSLNSLIPIDKYDESLGMLNNIKKESGVKFLIKKCIRKILNFIRKIPILGKLLSKIKQLLKKNAFFVKLYRKIRHIPTPENEISLKNKIFVDYRISESNKQIKPRKCNVNYNCRINILIPSLNIDKVFGGIATAMKFFDQFDDGAVAKRIIVTDSDIKKEDLKNYKNYTLVDCDKNCNEKYQIVDIHDRNHCELEVSDNDVFIATAWWTAYIIRPIIEWQKDTYNQAFKKLIYLIQDYEPYFYPWGSRYCLSESTYHMDVPTIGVFNSTELKEFFISNGYTFDSMYVFNPVLNDKLKYHLINDDEKKRKKRIICYGRPNVARNAFEIICESLILAFKDRNDANDWEFISMGEDHHNVIIKDNAILKPVGKLSIDEYALMMEEAYMGISLMISPHPSYPPLEMSSFGVKTITNEYSNKDLSSFNDNIISVKYCDPVLIAKKINMLLDTYDEKSSKLLNNQYLNSTDQFKPIIEDILKKIK